MEQIYIKDINGKTIKDCRFYEDYITILFDDNTFLHVDYDFDSDEGVGFWSNFWIDKCIDKNGYVLPEFATSYFWHGNQNSIVPEDKIRGPFEIGIIKCNYSDLMSKVEENYKRQLEWKRRSMIELASELGIELTEEQKKELDKFA